jgi:hydroxymethylbilane synthase
MFAAHEFDFAERLREQRNAHRRLVVAESSEVLALAQSFGEVEFVRGEHHGARIDRTTLRRSGTALPRAARADQLWYGDADGADPFERIEVPTTAQMPSAGTGLLVARADALPLHWRPDASHFVWTAGLTTWRKLAARGIWVAGTDDSLGETGGRDAQRLFPDVTRWLKLSHESGWDSPFAQRLATYRLRATRPLLPVEGRTHFFWRSGSQFLEYLRRYPGLADHAWHGCGPGNSLRQLSPMLAADRLRPFLSATQFAAECAS